MGVDVTNENVSLRPQRNVKSAHVHDPSNSKRRKRRISFISFPFWQVGMAGMSLAAGGEFSHFYRSAMAATFTSPTECFVRNVFRIKHLFFKKKNKSPGLMKFIRILLKKLLVTFIFFFKKKNKFLLNWDSCRPHLGTGWPSHDLLPLPAIWAAHKTLFFK